MQPLFADVPVKTKLAAPDGGELPRDVSQWPAKIRDEWLKVAPYAYKYPTEIVLEEMTDANKGMGFGHILLTSQTKLPPGKGMGQMGVELGIRTAKIPIIVQDFKLYPFDMIKTEDGHVLPLNEGRLGEALFRPTTFDIPYRGDLNELFGNPIYPPDREKAAAFPILTGIGPTIHEDQLERFADKLEKDAELQAEYRTSEPARAYLQYLSQIQTQEPLSKIAAEGLDRVLRPDVILVRKEKGKYLAKMASRDAYENRDFISMAVDEATERLGAQIVKEADAKGMIIIIRRRGGDGPEMFEDGPTPFMDGEGPCHVMGPGGRGMGGFLLPKILDLLTGRRTPFRMFTDGDHTGYQEDIGAIPGKSETVLKTTTEPSGLGSFCWEGEDGKVECTEPVRCSGKSSIGGRTSYLCETLDGKNIDLMKSPAIKTVSPANGKTLIPESAKWVVLGEKMIKLGTRSEIETRTSAKLAAETCTVSFDGSRFAIRGEPLEKIGEKLQVGPFEALYTLGLLGCTKEAGEQVLATAMKKRSVKLANTYPIRLLAEHKLEALNKVAGFRLQGKDVIDTIDSIAKIDLVKIASGLGDPTSVDAVLSLGFLNIDNVSRFIAYLPIFQDAQGKIGTLLLAARVGLSDLPQDHLERAFFALEQAIGGLKRLAARLSSRGQT